MEAQLSRDQKRRKTKKLAFIVGLFFDCKIDLPAPLNVVGNVKGDVFFSIKGFDFGHLTVYPLTDNNGKNFYQVSKCQDDQVIAEGSTFKELLEICNNLNVSDQQAN